MKQVRKADIPAEEADNLQEPKVLKTEREENETSNLTEVKSSTESSPVIKKKILGKNHSEFDEGAVEASKTEGIPKRTRASRNKVKSLPSKYEDCDVRDLVQLIGEMLLDLIQINDRLPLQEDALTRFHSRVPPGISVMDYLQRLATHASLSPPILLSMVYYIDKLCALYPAFIITSLTVHRYLIASATVASKGLSDTFWTNGTYARVGGVSVKELGLLELELLRRVDWRIVPKPEVLVEYYRSLVDRSEGFEIIASSGTNTEPGQKMPDTS